MSARKKNNVVVLGLGQRPIIFMHGFGCDQHVWRHVAPAFVNDWQVVLFDHMGAGGSDLSRYEPARYASFDGYADDLIDIVRELGLEQAVVVGHSVSAMIAVQAAIKEPTLFSKLVLIGPTPSLLNDGDYKGGFDRADIEGLLAAMESDFAGWSGMITPLIMGNPERPELAHELRDSFCRMDEGVARQFARLAFLSDMRPQLGKLAVPSLIMQCTADALASIEIGEYLHRHLRGSTLEVMKATGHCPHLSAPEETIEILSHWLATQ